MKKTTGNITATLSAKFYGVKLGKAVAYILIRLGASVETAMRGAYLFTFVRTSVDGKTVSWKWMGRH